MSGYGEFYWNEGKRYKGFYLNDKKEGFGVYYWHDKTRIYIGFWKNGKQEGLGKYITEKHSKWGKWEKGDRKLWYDNKNEAFTDNDIDINLHSKFFDMGLKEATEYIMN